MKKGFTLIELLIASAIFIIVMVMAASIFSWAAAYNTKLHEMRKVAQVNRAAMDTLSRDIRLANGKMKIKTKWKNDTNWVTLPSEEIGEIAFFWCNNASGGSCTIIKSEAADGAVQPTVLNDSTDAANDNYNAYRFDLLFDDPAQAKLVANSLMIVLRDQNKFIIYRDLRDAEAPSNYTLSRYEGVYSPTLDLTSINVGEGPGKWDKLNPDSASNPSSLRAAFAGYAATKSERKQQPYVEMLLRSESWNYLDVPEKLRAQLDLKTSVETRDYDAM